MSLSLKWFFILLVYVMVWIVMGVFIVFAYLWDYRKARVELTVYHRYTNKKNVNKIMLMPVPTFKPKTFKGFTYNTTTKEFKHKAE